MFGFARATDNAKSSVRGLKGETRIRIQKEVVLICATSSNQEDVKWVENL